MGKLQAAAPQAEEAQPTKRARPVKAQESEAARYRATRSDAYLCSGDHLVGSLDVGFLILPTEASAHSPAPSPTTGPSAASSRRLVDAMIRVISRRDRVAAVVAVCTQMYRLLTTFIEHALEPLHCSLPRPERVKQNWAEQVGQQFNPCYKHSLVTRLHHTRDHKQWLVLAFRGVDADSLVQALAHPPADVQPIHSWYGTGPLEPVLACVVPRSHPIFRLHPVWSELAASVVCFSPPWDEEPSEASPDDGTPPPQRAVRVASTVAAVYVHMLRRAHPQWRSTMSYLADPRHVTPSPPGSPSLIEPSSDPLDDEVNTASHLRSAAMRPSQGSTPDVRTSDGESDAPPLSSAAAASSSLSAADARRGPFLCVGVAHGEADKIVRFDTGEALYSWMRGWATGRAAHGLEGGQVGKQSSVSTTQPQSLDAAVEQLMREEVGEEDGGGSARMKSVVEVNAAAAGAMRQWRRGDSSWTEVPTMR